MPYSSPSAPRVDNGRLSSMQQAIQRHPQVSALLRQGNTAGAEYYIRTHRDEFGFDLPAGYRLKPNGTFDYTATTNQDHWWTDPRIMGPIAVGALGGAGILAGPAAAGGGGAAATGAGAAGTLPSSSLPVGSLMGGAPAIASQGASGLGTVATTGAGASGVARAASGSGIGRKLLDNLTSVDGVASLAPLIASLASGGMGGGDNGGFNNEFMERAYGDAKRIQGMQEARFRRTDPLHEAVTQLAFSRLPTSAQAGINPQRIPLPPQE